MSALNNITDISVIPHPPSCARYISTYVRLIHVHVHGMCPFTLKSTIVHYVSVDYAHVCIQSFLE